MDATLEEGKNERLPQPVPTATAHTERQHGVSAAGAADLVLGTELVTTL